MAIAPRASVFLKTGEWPELHVCHHCDNPKCVNPDHLFLGTQKDNLDDMTRKGRRRGGGTKRTRHPKARFTEKEISVIKGVLKRHPTSKSTNALSSGITLFLARWFGVSSRTISAINVGQNWR